MTSAGETRLEMVKRLKNLEGRLGRGWRCAGTWIKEDVAKHHIVSLVFFTCMWHRREGGMLSLLLEKICLTTPPLKYRWNVGCFIWSFVWTFQVMLSLSMITKPIFFFISFIGESDSNYFVSIRHGKFVKTHTSGLVILALLSFTSSPELSMLHHICHRSPLASIHDLFPVKI